MHIIKPRLLTIKIENMVLNYDISDAFTALVSIRPVVTTCDKLTASLQLGY